MVNYGRYNGNIWIFDTKKTHFFAAKKPPLLSWNRARVCLKLSILSWCAPPWHQITIKYLETLQFSTILAKQNKVLVVLFICALSLASWDTWFALPVILSLELQGNAAKPNSKALQCRCLMTSDINGWLEISDYKGFRFDSVLSAVLHSFNKTELIYYICTKLTKASTTRLSYL